MQTFSHIRFSPELRLLGAVIVVPPLTIAFVVAARAACARTAPTTDWRASLEAAYFVHLCVFVPAWRLLEGRLRLGAGGAVLLGLFAAWVAPAVCMLLMTVWRGDLLNSFVTDASDLLLSPSNALVGALGALLFWLVAAAPLAPLRIALPAPLSSAAAQNRL